jgi:integrase
MLSQSIDAYLELRRSLGSALSNEEYLLRAFARFASGRGQAHVRTGSVVEWAAGAPSPQERQHRLRTLARFAAHARAEDPRHELPPIHVFAHRHVRRLPRIYTAEEIRRLLEAASRLGPAGSLRPHTYTTLLGLLAATGLRVSEALALRLDDITDDGLVIRETKFHKSRLVPLHPTTQTALERYLQRRRRVRATTDRVFLSPRGSGLPYYTVHTRFLDLAREAGLPRRAGNRHPLLHDLRHTFAVRALETSPGGTGSVSRHMRALSTYLGHANVADTYWYLQVTPRLVRDIANACEAFLEGGER